MNDLTGDKVLSRLNSRFNTVLNEGPMRKGRPKVPHKTATATITRIEYETLKTEFLEMKAKLEIDDSSFEAIYLTQEDLA